MNTGKFPRISADEIRAKLDQKPPASFAEPEPHAATTPTLSDSDSAAKPSVGQWFGEWQTRELPGGDWLVLVRVPEAYVQALTAEGERHGFGLAEQLRDLLERMHANGQT
jgi:hypothetical protein